MRQPIQIHHRYLVTQQLELSRHTSFLLLRFIPEEPPQDLARWILRDQVDEAHILDALILGHPLIHKRDDLIFRSLLSRFRHNVRSRVLVSIPVALLAVEWNPWTGRERTWVCQ